MQTRAPLTKKQNDDAMKALFAYTHTFFDEKRKKMSKRGIRIKAKQI